MEKRYKIGLGILLLFLGALIFLEANKPAPINWTPSYAHIDKIPLGSYVFYEGLKEKFPETFQRIKQPAFEFLNDTTRSGTYFFLNNQISFDKAELEKLLAWTAKGNTVFIAADYIGGKLLDTLRLEIGEGMSFSTIKSEPLLNFVNPNLKRDSAYHYRHNTDLYYFTKIDTSTQTVLGVTDLFEEPPVLVDSWVNFVEAPFGKGTIFIHLFPQAFGNYFMLLNENHEYAEKAMAYIDFDKPVYWDGYYKVGNPYHTSPLYVLLGNKYLKWAYYFVVIGTLFFVFFEGKRKQKSIKIVPPLQNKTHDFTRTIAGMYLEEQQHKIIAEKQIDLFLAYIRNDFRVATHNLDTTFLENISVKSGNPLEETQELFGYIAEVQKKQQLNKKELMRLNELITKFKK